MAERCGPRRCRAGSKATQRANVIQLEDLIGQLITTDRTAVPYATCGYDVQGSHVSIRDNVYQTAAGIFYEHGGTAGDFSQAYDTRVTELTYDARGRQTSRMLPLGVATPANPDDFVERRFYSDRSVAAAVTAGGLLTESVALGQLEYEISFEGVVTAYRYNNSLTGGGRLVAQYFYGGATAVADYLADAADGILTAADEAVVYGYDAFGRQVQVIQDRDGNLLTTADQRVETTEYDTQSLSSTVSTPEGLQYPGRPSVGGFGALRSPSPNAADYFLRVAL